MATGKEQLEPLLPVPGVRLAAVAAGVRYQGRRDVVILELAEGSLTTGVYTRNAFCAAPVQIARRHEQSCNGQVRYLLVNTGNANAGTGQQGMSDAQKCCEALAELTGVSVSQVLPFSTGVIGERLPTERIIAALPDSLGKVAADSWHDAAVGIMTTDTRPKGISRTLELDGKTVTITGISKGAGMIKPNMATMLAFVATDAKLDLPLLKELLFSAVEQSFNRITVDGDTSTNDCCMLTATGQSGVEISRQTPELLARFADLLTEVVRELAILIIRDAEGARKFVTVDVRGGSSVDECLKVAYTIAESPLVKTAFSASDPNWGRILAAIGRAGIDGLDVSLIDVYLGQVKLVEGGGLADSYTEAQGQAVMAEEDILLRVELGRGETREQVWTADLSEEYVRINASYRS